MTAISSAGGAPRAELQAGTRTYQFIRDRLDDQRDEQHPHGHDAYLEAYRETHDLYQDYADAVHAGHDAAAERGLRQLAEIAERWNDHPDCPALLGEPGAAAGGSMSATADTSTATGDSGAAVVMIYEEIERLGRAMDAGEITRHQAVAALVTATAGGLNHAGARDVFDDWPAAARDYRDRLDRAPATLASYLAAAQARPDLAATLEQAARTLTNLAGGQPLHPDTSPTHDDGPAHRGDPHDRRPDGGAAAADARHGGGPAGSDRPDDTGTTARQA